MAIGNSDIFLTLYCPIYENATVFVFIQYFGGVYTLNDSNGICGSFFHFVCICVLDCVRHFVDIHDI